MSDANPILNTMQAINTLDNVDDATLLLNKIGATKELAQTTLQASKFSEGIADMDSVLAKIGTKGSASFSTFLTGIGSAIKPFLPMLGALSVALAGIAAFKWADNKFTLTYDTAGKKLDESSGSYTQTLQEISSLDSELSNVQNRIAQLQGLPSLSFSDEAELSKLQRQEQSLQNQIKLKQTLAKSQMEQAASDAKTKVNWESERSDTEKTLITAGGHGESSTTLSVAEPLTMSQKLEEDLAEYESLQKKIDKLENSDSPLGKKKTKELKDYKSQIKETAKSISDMYSEYEADSMNFYNPDTGKAIDGYEKEAAEYERIQALVSTMGEPKGKKDTALVDSFFNGSTPAAASLKDHFLELAKAGKLTEDSFSKMGLSTESLGIDKLSTAVDYFEQLASAADKAAQNTAKVDGSFNGVAAAFQSQNAGDKYLTLNDYLAKGKELFEQGLTGTDDFKTVAELISQGIDSSGESFQANYEKLQRYMDTGSNESIQNFLTDLGSNSLASWDDTRSKWNVDIDSTAEAAAKTSLENLLEIHLSLTKNILQTV